MNRGYLVMDNEKNHVVIISKFIRDYAIISTFLIYFLGFIYTAGELSYFIDGLKALPFSLDLFLKNGVPVVIVLLVSFLISSFLIRGIRKYKNEREKKLIKNLSPITRKISVNVGLILVFLVGCIFLLLNIKLDMGISVLLIGTLSMVYFTWILVLNDLLGEQSKLNDDINKILHTDENEQIKYIRLTNENDEFLRSRKRFVNSINGYLFIVASFVLVTLVYLSGAYFQKLNIERYLSGEGSFKFATIYNEKGNRQDYLVVDTTKDFLIGYQNGTIVAFPTSKVTKIEINEVILVRKNMIKPTDEISNDEKMILNSIDSFYMTLTKTLNAQKYMELISTKYNRDKMNSTPVEVVSKRLNSEKIYNGKTIDKFISYSVSKPNKIGDKYEVFVNEYWLDENVSVRFVYEKENSTWKISDINYKKYFLKYN